MTVRVMLIDVNYRGSSTGEIVGRLRDYLIENGSEAYVCYGRGEESGDESVYKFGLDAETALHALITRVTGWTGRFSPLSTQRLIRRIDEFNPDVIHIHELHAYFVDYGRLLKHIAKKGIPVVFTFHCEFMHTGKCGYAYDCQRYLMGCGECPRLREYPKTLTFDHTRAMLKEKIRLIGGMERLICCAPSGWLARRAEESLLPVGSVNVVFNGLDTDVFRPVDATKLRSELGLSDKPVMLAVAPDYQDPRKGLDALVALAKRMPEYRLVLVGGNAPESSGNILSVGSVKQRERLAEYYSMADVFLLTSQFETFSMTCAEALCCGTPVAGFKAGAPEGVFPKEYAEFVEYGDTQALEAAARAAAQKKARREEIAAAGSALFDWRVMCGKYMELYERAVRI